MQKIFISILLLTLIFGCTNSEKDKKKFPGKVATSSTKNKIMKIKHQPIKIKIDLSDVVKGDFSDFFNLKNIIYLDDKKAIGEISVIRQFGDKIFILDRKNTQQLFCYNLKGKLIWEFNSKGGGPLEYGKISDFVINEKDKTIDLLDNSRYKIINIDINTGIAKNEFKLGCYGSEMILYDNQDYLLYTSNFTVNEELNYKLLLVNNNQKINSKNLFVQNYEEDKHWKGFRSLEKYDNTIYFTETLNDTIYTIKNDTLKTEYYVDFLDKKYPNDLKSNYSFSKHKKLNKNKPYVYSISRVREKNGILNFMFAYNSEFYSVFYDIKKQSTFIFNSLNEGITFGEKEHIIMNGYIDDGFIKTIQPFILESVKKQIESNQELKNYLIENKPEMYDVMLKTNESSNPVLFIYEFKKNN